MKLVLVCGPWSSGTTAVAGLLERLGAAGLGPPYFMSFDERTPNTYELEAFRQVVMRLASEETVSLRPDVAPLIVPELRAFRDRIAAGEIGSGDAAQGRPIFLKYPLSALLIPQICEVFDTRLIYVIRPLKDIEATRQRRRWPPQFGVKGARAIYSALFHLFVEGTFPTLFVRYRELVACPVEGARAIAAFSGIDAGDDLVERAASFITRSGMPVTGSAR